jgi:hypothetical protein
LLDAVNVVGQRVVEELRERADRGRVGERLARARVRVPDAIDEAEAGVTVDGDRERRGERLALDAAVVRVRTV